MYRTCRAPSCRCVSPCDEYGGPPEEEDPYDGPDEEDAEPPTTGYLARPYTPDEERPF